MSIPSEGTIQFVIKQQLGFTQTLNRSVKSKGGRKIRVILDGPYGSLETTRFDKYEHVILVAGGIGITWAMTVLKAQVQHSIETLQSKELTFVWAVREESSASYFLGILEQINTTVRSHNEKSEKGVQLNIHVYKTGAAIAGDTLNGEKSEPWSSLESSVQICPPQNADPVLTNQGKKNPTAIVRSDSAQSLDSTNIEISHGRPDIRNLLCSELSSLNRIAIGVCGPVTLVKVAKESVAANLSLDKDVFLYTEAFEW